jgi:hypothetical protein
MLSDKQKLGKIRGAGDRLRTPEGPTLQPARPLGHQAVGSTSHNQAAWCVHDAAKPFARCRLTASAPQMPFHDGLADALRLARHRSSRMMRDTTMFVS